MAKLTLRTPEYTALLARWSQLVLKRDRDGLARQEASELARVNDQMGRAELANAAAADVPQGASGLAQICTDYEYLLSLGDYGGQEG